MDYLMVWKWNKKVKLLLYCLSKKLFLLYMVFVGNVIGKLCLVKLIMLFRIDYYGLVVLMIIIINLYWKL